MSSLVSSKHYVRYDGKDIETTVTDKQAIANEWVRGIYSKYSGIPKVVGLDIEWRPTFIQSTSNKSATLQLCIDTKCLILQLFYVDAIPNLLKAFLEDPNFTFVGVEVEGDALKLENEYGLKCSNRKDILEIARAKLPGKYLSKPGLKVLASDICGLHMPKPKHICMSNWEARVLNTGQIEYACIDAYASYKIGYRLIIDKRPFLLLEDEESLLEFLQEGDYYDLQGEDDSFLDFLQEGYYDYDDDVPEVSEEDDYGIKEFR